MTFIFTLFSFHTSFPPPLYISILPTHFPSPHPSIIAHFLAVPKRKPNECKQRTCTASFCLVSQSIIVPVSITPYPVSPILFPLFYSRTVTYWFAGFGDCFFFLLPLSFFPPQTEIGRGSCIESSRALGYVAWCDSDFWVFNLSFVLILLSHNQMNRIPRIFKPKSRYCPCSSIAPFFSPILVIVFSTISYYTCRLVISPFPSFILLFSPPFFFL